MPAAGQEQKSHYFRKVVSTGNTQRGEAGNALCVQRLQRSDVSGTARLPAHAEKHVCKATKAMQALLLASRLCGSMVNLESKAMQEDAEGRARSSFN